MNEEKTIFEKLVSGELPCAKVYEDEETFAFLNIKPNSIGHTLVITKKPYRNIFDLPTESAKNLFASVKKISMAIRKAINCDGLNIVINNEKAANQVIFHIHVHLIPRKNGDDLNPDKYVTYKDGEMDYVAKKIATELE